MEDDGAPTLSVGFLIDTTDSFSELAQLQRVMDSTEAQVLQQAAAIEKATGGMVNLGGATAGVKTFNAAASLAERDLRVLERTGMSLSRQLEKQAETFGMNRSQIQAMRVETTALALAEKGRTDQAEALRSKAQALYDLEFAAMRRAKAEADALAEEKLRAVMAAEAETRAIRDAAAAHALFEAKARQGVQAMREQESAAARDAVALERLREILDPVGASQARLNQELSEARRLLTAAGASSEQLARAQQIITQNAGGVVRSQGAVRAGALQLTQNLNDVAVQYQMQTPLMTIFTQQSGQVVGALSLMSGQAKGFLGVLAGPWGLGITTAIALLAPFVAKLWDGADAAKAHEEAMKAQKKALEDLDAATGRGNKTLEQRIALGVAATKTALQQAQATRDQTKADLEQALAAARIRQNMDTGIGSEGDGSAAFGAAIGDIQISRLTKALKEQNVAIAENEERLRAAGRPALMAQIVAMTDKNAAAIKRLTDRQAELYQAYDKGRIGEDQFLADGLAIQQQLAALEGADKAAAAAKREHNKEVREATRLQNELRASYDKFLAIADPDRAILEQYRKDLEELKRVALAFNFDADTLAQFENALRDQMMKARGLALQFLGQPLEIKFDIDTSKLTQALPHFRTLQDSLDEMSAAAERLGRSLPDAFGRTGNAVANLLKITADYGQEQKKIDASTDSDALKRQRSSELQLDTLVGLTSAARGLFKEHSAGYKAMLAAEQALTVVQLARTAVDVAGGAARMFASLGPLGFPAVAAMLAVMASLGFRSGGRAGSAPKYNDGTGTVFGGAPDAKSDSIKRSIDLLADIDTDLLGVSRQMAASLKAIESNIGGLSRLVIRLGGVDGIGSDAAVGVNTGFKSDILGKTLDEFTTRAIGGLGLGAIGFAIAGPIGALAGLAAGVIGDLAKKIPIIGDILGGVGKLLGSLFGSKTKIVGQGIFGGPQTLGSIEDMGFAGQSFADIKKTKKFFGVSTGSSYKTQFGELDDALEDQFGKLILSFADAIKLAAGPLGIGLDDIDAKLSTFVVDIGKIDLKDLSGDEIQEKLEAVFGAQADKMAQFAIAGLEQFQQVGEGYFETLIRVASTVDTVTTSLQMLGLSAQSLGTDASMAIAGFFDNAAAYQDAAGAYFEAFYTDAEQAAAKTAQLGKVFDAFGIEMPDTIAAFRSLVEAQDLTTEAGQQMYATLLQLAPAFAEIIGSGTSASSSSANAILRERNDLERQLMEIAGDTAGIRAAELAQLDPTNRALQERIYALQDEAAAAQVAAQAAQDLAAQQRAVAQERAGLERQMLELNGNTAALRELDLQNVDESNRDLLKQIFARQDAIAAEAAAQAAAAEAQRQAEQAAEEAARAAKALADAWSSIGDSIMDEVKRIRGGMLSEAQSYQQLQLQFFAATDAARAGSQDAAKSLPELARSMLEAAEATATDSLMLKRIRDVTAASLEQTYGVIATAMGLGGSAQTQEQLVQRFVDGVQASNAASGAAGDTGSEIRALRAEVAQMRAENNSGHAKTADEASGSRKVLERSQAYAADGNSLSVKVAA